MAPVMGNMSPVTRRTDRQELADPLDNGQNNYLENKMMGSSEGLGERCAP
jgi:hypothetical protein